MLCWCGRIRCGRSRCDGLEKGAFWGSMVGRWSAVQAIYMPGFMI